MRFTGMVSAVPFGEPSAQQKQIAGEQELNRPLNLRVTITGPNPDKRF
jgi:hypothetical protein